VLDFSHASQGYLIDRPSGPRRLLSNSKINLNDICWVYVEKSQTSGWLDLDAHFLYTMKIYLRDGKVIEENLDTRKTNVNGRYAVLRKVVPWAVFGYTSKQMSIWENYNKKFISYVDEKRAAYLNGKGAGPKGSPRKQPAQDEAEIKKALEKDYFKILGVPKTVTVAELNVRYRELALKHHPDRNKDPNSLAKFKEISEAYAIVHDFAEEWTTNK
jgi:DnaJ domain